MTQPAKHTPGPWFYNYDDHCIVNQAGVSVVNVRGAMGGNDTNADTALIAAAPAMYLELKESLVLLRASYHDMCEKHGADSLHAQVIFERIESVGATLAQADGKQ